MQYNFNIINSAQLICVRVTYLFNQTNYIHYN